MSYGDCANIEKIMPNNYHAGSKIQSPPNQTKETESDSEGGPQRWRGPKGEPKPIFVLFSISLYMLIITALLRS